MIRTSAAALGLAAQGFDLLPLSAAHAIRAGAFPREHRDPFDRMIAAQALVEGWRWFRRTGG